MTTLWKYPIPIEDRFTLSLPEGAVIRHLAVQGSQTYLWVEVDPDRVPETRAFFWVGTGHSFPQTPTQEQVYLGTVHLDGLGLVFHLYEIVNPKTQL